MGHREEGDERIWDKSQVSVLGGWWLVTFRKNNRFGDAGFSGAQFPPLSLPQLIFISEEGSWVFGVIRKKVHGHRAVFLYGIP